MKEKQAEEGGGEQKGETRTTISDSEAETKEIQSREEKESPNALVK